MNRPLSTLLIILLLNHFAGAQCNLHSSISYRSSLSVGGFRSILGAIRYGQYLNTINFDFRPDSTRLSLGCKYSSGLRQYTFNYIDQDPFEYYLGFPPVYFTGTQEFNFRFHEFSFEGKIHAGKHLVFTVGPYVTYNSKKQINDRSSRYYLYSPNTVANLFRRFELGGQFGLALQFKIGKYFSIMPHGLLGRSFTDLRKKQWKDAKTYFSSQGVITERPMYSVRLVQKFYEFGVGVGMVF
jgi:hypothetical protein